MDLRSASPARTVPNSASKILGIKLGTARRAIPSRVLGQQIVTSRARDFAGYKFPDRGRFGQDYPGIDIRSVRFGPRDQRLIDKKLQLAADFFAGDLVGDLLLHRHGLPVTAILFLRRDLIRHFRGPRSLFL